MLDTRFYVAGKGIALSELAARTGARLASSDHAVRIVRAAAPLESAEAEEVAYFASGRYRSRLCGTRAGAVFVTDADASDVPSACAVLLCAYPARAFAAAARLLAPVKESRSGISERAVVDPSARLGADVVVAPGAVIEGSTEIGERTVIGANAVIGHGVAVGRDCWIGSNASLTFALVGDRVRIQAGARIGQDGFGFSSDGKDHLRIPQQGRVIIQDDVEIGANCTVDRGAAGDTVIGQGTKIDNLVHVGHNCRIGRHCILIAQVGLSGSVTLGDFVVLAGKVGVMDHLCIGDGARVAARSAVTKNVPAGAVYAGFPAKPIADWRRQSAILGKMAKESRKTSSQRGKSR